MADKKISELDAVGTSADTDQIPVVQSGTTKRATLAQIMSAGGVEGLEAAWSNTVVVEGDNSTRATKATEVQAAIDAAVADSKSFVFVPHSFLNYDASAVTFDNSVRMVREGQVGDVYDVKAYGAAAGTSDDQKAAFQAAADAMPSEGGVLYVPADTGGYNLATTVTLSNPTLVLGGWIPGESSQNGASRLIKDAAATSEILKLDAISCGIYRVQAEGEAGNTGDGILVNRAQCVLRDVAVFDMGQDGIRIGGSDGNNVNLWRMHNVRCFGNGRHGVNIDDTGQGGGVVDANAGIGVGIDVKNNGNDGLRVDAARLNSFYGVRAESNTGAGVHLAGEADLNAFHGGDLDEGNSPDLLIDSGATNNSFVYPNVQETNVTDNGSGTSLLLPRGGDVSKMAANVLQLGNGGSDVVALQVLNNQGSFNPMQVPAGTRSLQFGAASTGGVNDVSIEESTGIVRLSEQGGRVMLGAANSAPADGDLNNSEVSFWLDETGDDLEVKVKQSDGTVLTATLASLT